MSYACWNICTCTLTSSQNISEPSCIVTYETTKTSICLAVSVTSMSVLTSQYELHFNLLLGKQCDTYYIIYYIINQYLFYTQTLGTNQFSVTRHQRSVRAVSGETGLPGMWACPVLVTPSPFSFSRGILHLRLVSDAGSADRISSLICTLSYQCLCYCGRGLHSGRYARWNVVPLGKSA